jgi:hypothetical protein
MALSGVPLLAAQTTLQGGVSTDSTSLKDIYAGQDPLAGRPQMMPPASNGRCIPPNGNWILIRQTASTCYYFQRYPTPLQGRVMTPQEAGQSTWTRCSAHPWDPILVICYGTPQPKSGSSPEPPSGSPYPPNSKYVPLTPGPPGGYPAPYNVGSTIRNPDPCHPAVNMSTPQGRAQAQITLAQNRAACKAERCQQNPQAPGCSTTTPSRPLVANVVDYVRGLRSGAGDCIQNFGDLLVGANSFAHGDFVGAARSWGLTPGQSVTLKAIYAEGTQTVVGQNVSASDQGRIAGRRICMYGLIPGGAKAGGEAWRAGVPGTSALNPLKGTAVLEESTNQPASLAGKFIQTADGPLQLGNFMGSGTFGSVYKLPKGLVAKISNSSYGSSESFPRQLEGSHRLRQIGVDTPTIYRMEPAGPGTPALLVMDDVFSKWKGVQQMGTAAYNKLLSGARAPYDAALTKLSNQLADAGYIWPDNHLNNVMFRPSGVGLSAIVHDSDMVLTVPEMETALRSGLSVPGQVLRGALEAIGQDGLLDQQPLNPATIMNALRAARIGGGLGGSTVQR